MNINFGITCSISFGKSTNLKNDDHLTYNALSHDNMVA